MKEFLDRDGVKELLRKVKSYVDNNSGEGVIGEVIWHAGGTIPNKFLLCDGREVERDKYEELFNVIGTIYGEGNGSTTFNLPNLTDNRFIEGSNSAGATHGSAMPAHSHSTDGNHVSGVFSDPTNYAQAMPVFRDLNSTNKDSNYDDLWIYNGSSVQKHTDVDWARVLSSGTGSAGSGDHVQPKSLELLPCIRCGVSVPYIDPYEEMSYLYFNNTSSSVGYIDTHIKHKTGYKYSCKVRHKSQLYTYCSLYGVRESSNTLHAGFQSSAVYFNYNATGSSISYNALNNTVEMEHEATRFDIYPENNKFYKSTYSQGTATSSLNIWLGCINKNNTVLEPFNGYVFGWKVEEGENTIINLIPVKLARDINVVESIDIKPHKKDEVGFWDTVGDKFYPVSGVASRITAVALPTYYEQIDGVTLKTTADGGIHFDTRYPWEVESRYIWDGVWNGVYGGNNVFFGSKYNGNGSDGIQLRSDSNNMYVSSNANAVTIEGNHAGEHVNADFYWGYGGSRFYVVKIGDTQKMGSFSGSFTANSNSIYLNAINYNGTTRDATNTSIFAFKIQGVKYNSISDIRYVTLRNFVPAKATMAIPAEWVSTKANVSAGTLGLWDTIFGIFYPVIGSGTITEYIPPEPIQELSKLYTTSSDAVFDLECQPDGGSKWELGYTFKSGGDASRQVGKEKFLVTLYEEGSSFVTYVNGKKSRSSFDVSGCLDHKWDIYIDQKDGTCGGIAGVDMTGVEDPDFVPDGISLNIGALKTKYGLTSYHPYEFYYSKLTDKDGNVVSDIVPVKLGVPLTQDGTTYPEGTIGLYDKVTERFLPKIGSGEVIGVL